VTSTIFDYGTSIYLQHSVSLRGKKTTATTSDDVQSYTEYDGSPDQKQLYTFNLKSGVKWVAGWASSYAASDVVTSTIFDYGTSVYLQHSASLRGKKTSATTSDDVQSFTEYDGSPDQKQLYTFNLKSGVKWIAAFASSYQAQDVVTSTIFDYGTSVYLQHS